MKIQLRSVLDIAHLLGGKEHSIDVGDAAVVLDLIGLLIAKHGEPLRALMLQSDVATELLPHVKIYVNGRGIDFLAGLETVLHDGDDVVIMPQISGG